MNQFQSLLLLVFSNVFMTFAWYGHLKNLNGSPLWIAISTSWGIAFFEYCLQVPANRIGSSVFTLSQLKVSQEIITMIVFAVFSTFYMNTPVTRNYFYATLCLLGAAYFIFRK
jgi:uncharacterized protein (DUF486 family)